MNLLHVLLLTLILLAVTPLSLVTKSNKKRWSATDITFVIYLLYYLIVDIMGNLN